MILEGLDVFVVALEMEGGIVIGVVLRRLVLGIGIVGAMVMAVCVVMG